MSILTLKENTNNNKEYLNIFSEEFLFNSVLNCINDGVVIADKNGHFVFWNKAAEQIVGLGNSDTKPNEWSQYYGCFLPDRITPYPNYDLPLTRAIRGNYTDKAKMFIRNQNINGVFININGHPIKNDAGEISGGIVIFQGIDKSFQSNPQAEKKRKQHEKEFRSLEHLKYVSKLDAFSKLFDFEPLNKTEPSTFNEILNRYKNLIDLSININEHKWGEEITSELCLLAKKLVFLKASPSDIIDIHNLAIKKKLENKPEDEIEVLIESGRRISLELMSFLISYYRNNSIGLNRSNGLIEGKLKTL